MDEDFQNWSGLKLLTVVKQSISLWLTPLWTFNTFPYQMNAVLRFSWHANHPVLAVLQVPKRFICYQASTTTVSDNGSGRQMDRLPRHGRPPAVRVSVVGFYLPGQRGDRRRLRRLGSFADGSRTQFPPLSDEARSDPTKMIIHRVRTALIWVTVAVAASESESRGWRQGQRRVSAWIYRSFWISCSRN